MLTTGSTRKILALSFIRSLHFDISPNQYATTYNLHNLQTHVNTFISTSREKKQRRYHRIIKYILVHCFDTPKFCKSNENQIKKNKNKQIRNQTRKGKHKMGLFGSRSGKLKGTSRAMSVGATGKRQSPDARAEREQRQQHDNESFSNLSTTSTLQSPPAKERRQSRSTRRTSYEEFMRQSEAAERERKLGKVCGFLERRIWTTSEQDAGRRNAA
ncbi:uncharacterized protein RCO7_07132 [Rhynchosporium graminicola]|nr:uncharacterized protein RCO7_07132 [Rhynchosporium commune]